MADVPRHQGRTSRHLFGQRDFGRYFVSGVVVTGGVVIAPGLSVFLAATAVT